MLRQHPNQDAGRFQVADGQMVMPSSPQLGATGANSGTSYMSTYDIEQARSLAVNLIKKQWAKDTLQCYQFKGKSTWINMDKPW